MPINPQPAAASFSTVRRAARPVLLCGSSGAPRILTGWLATEQVEYRVLDTPTQLCDWGTPGGLDAPTVLLLDAALATALAGAVPDPIEVLDAPPPGLVVVPYGAESDPRLEGLERAFLPLAPDAALASVQRHLQAAFRFAASQLAVHRAGAEVEQSRAELRELNRIGMALMTERDPDRLLACIVTQARELTGSDAGSLYLLESSPNGPARLRFKVAQNETLPNIPFQEFTLPVDHRSVAGYSAATGETVRIDDAYHLPADAPYTFDRTFDERWNYRTCSVLAVPMVDYRGVVVGVLQLINRRAGADDDPQVLPFGQRELELAQSLAGQAAVSIENGRLHREIERLFDHFVTASVAAIEQRDPTTAGHSVRVATLTCGMAQLLERMPGGPYAGTTFTREQMREMRFASLLHDFGKVGVREDVLIKAKKLPPQLWERVQNRFDLLRRTLEAEFHRRRADFLEQYGQAAWTDTAPRWQEEFRDRLADAERWHEAIRVANEPTVLPERTAEVLDQIADERFAGADGTPTPILSPDELRFLKIPKGSLDAEERREIESHVEQTYHFLLQIPWTEDLRFVPEIAYAHHEKMNGAGYPRGIRATEIPVQSRIMTVADIFDALTASDRPYKRSLSADRALDILRAEARDGLLDSDLVNLLIESGTFRTVLERDWREL